MAADDPYRVFRTLVETADRKFSKTQSLPPHARGPHHLLYLKKTFKSYTKLWRFQQDHRRDLVSSGLRRWEIGEIASRIGQLYYNQYLRTSEARFLVEAYVFYEAILSRGYFEAKTKGEVELGLRCKELRFHARFLLVAMLLNRKEVVKGLVERLRVLIDDCRVSFPGTNFKEWKQVLQEIVRFLKLDASFLNTRPLRYNVLFDSHPSSIPYIKRFHARRALRLQDALLTSYHRNEVKFTELTLDTYRMMQCLEWEPSGSFYEMPKMEPRENGAISDNSAASGLIDINLAADMIDSSLPANPRKSILYHPYVLHLIAVLGTIIEELSSDSILLIYISATGNSDQNIGFQRDTYSTSLNASKLHPASRGRHKWDDSPPKDPARDMRDSNQGSGSYLCLGSRGSGGLNNLYPEDLIPFTRRPLFVIIDSDNSQAFKVLHGAERGETAALLLSPERPSSISPSDLSPNGSQFTFFLTAPLLAFCQLLGLSSNVSADAYNNAETIVSSAIAEWEVALCTSNCLDPVWAQILPDPFLRRLIVRFIFCRAVLSLFYYPEKDGRSLPECLPSLPDAVSPNSASTQSYILRLAESLGVSSHFHLPEDNGVSSSHSR
ncbi:uncharacterized protein A4U43_C03F3150 [Asparagus officinalis]|uniref:RGS domain-containing protein n=1 Tax=Asparagus officinalis TaxID=4686 RepID=A0A5P1F9P3_ASPOF|nr:protein SCAI [Asparagus officinalis]ONK74137.1 uncharacterized protein A4U43_C03F3150 [Asparagus officinalis]